MHLAKVGKLAKVKKYVEYLQIRQDLFDRIVDERRIKTKIPMKRSRQFQLRLQKRRHQRKHRSTREQSLQEIFKSFAKLKEYKVTLLSIKVTIFETKAAFAESTIRTLENTLNRFLEEYG